MGMACCDRVWLQPCLVQHIMLSCKDICNAYVCYVVKHCNAVIQCHAMAFGTCTAMLIELN